VGGERQRRDRQHGDDHARARERAGASPGPVRITAGALAYNISQALFGETSPVVDVWLNDLTGGAYGFAAYLATASQNAAAFPAVLCPDHEAARRAPC
jgi:hypothetical protein